MRGFDLYPGAMLVDYNVLNCRDEKSQEEECQRRNHARNNEGSGRRGDNPKSTLPCNCEGIWYTICHVSLFRFVKKLQQSTDKNVTLGYKRNRQIFTDEEEQKLSEYVKTASAIYFGLSPAAVRKLAFECAVMFKKVIPENWTSKKIAGADWFSGFLKRHTDISVRTPESTSIARATSFNQYNVKAFYQKLAQVLDRHQF